MISLLLSELLFFLFFLKFHLNPNDLKIRTIKKYISRGMSMYLEKKKKRYKKNIKPNINLSNEISEYI